MQYYDLADLDHDPEIAKALGNLVVVWARTESALSFVLSEVMEINPNKAQIIFHRIPGFQGKINFIKTLIEQSDYGYDRKGKLLSSVSLFEKLALQRNHWIHGIWCVNEGRHETSLFHFRGKAEAQRTPVKAKDIIDHITAVQGEIEKIRVLLPSMPWT